MSLRFTDPADFQRQLLADPTLFAQEVDLLREVILFLQLTQDDYRKASFLDGRIVTPQTKGAYIRFGELEAALQGAKRRHPVHFIFHSGHVGSTLLSRLLQDVGGVIPIREPACLRTLAEAEETVTRPDSLVSPERFDWLLKAQLLLWGRGYPDTRAAIVKATSSAISLGPRLLSADDDARAICLNLRLEPYLATLLAGENSPLDLKGHAARRMRRLTAIAGDPDKPVHSLSVGELAAMAWVVESLAQAQLSHDFGERVLTLDFDVLLANVATALSNASAHFNLAVDGPALANAMQSPALTSYSKAPDHPYSPQMRTAQLNHARSTRADEIRAGQRWVERFAQGSPAVAALLA